LINDDLVFLNIYLIINGGSINVEKKDHLIRETLTKITSEYLREKKKSPGKNKFKGWFHKDTPKIISRVFIKDKLSDFHIKASAGEGIWKRVPWIAILHNKISMSMNTKNPEKLRPSAKWGFYVAYLFSINMKRIVLGLVQAEHSVKKEYKKETDDVLSTRAAILRKKNPEYKKNFTQIKTVLDKRKDAERYIRGTAFGKIYDSKKLPTEERLRYDLLTMFSLFCNAIERGGIYEVIPKTFQNDDDLESQGFERKTKKHVNEEKEYMKTDPKHIRFLKKENNYTCQACGLKFDKIYGNYSKKNNFIEAHHIVPKSITVKKVATDEKVSVNKDDFAILCANCHRMIHRMMNAQNGKVISLNEFKERISVKFKQYINNL